MSQLQDDLNAVAALLEPEGAWCQNEYEGEDDAGCLINAIHQVTEGTPAREPLPRTGRFRACCDALIAVVHATWTHDPLQLADWNDQPERTQAEVVSLVRAAAATA
jgi:hypothetical protein